MHLTVNGILTVNLADRDQRERQELGFSKARVWWRGRRCLVECGYVVDGHMARFRPMAETANFSLAAAVVAVDALPMSTSTRTGSREHYPRSDARGQCSQAVQERFI